MKLTIDKHIDRPHSVGLTIDPDDKIKKHEETIVIEAHSGSIKVYLVLPHGYELVVPKKGTPSQRDQIIEFLRDANRPQIKQMFKAMERQKRNTNGG